NATTFGRIIGSEEITVVSEATAACNRNEVSMPVAMFAKGPSCELEKNGGGTVVGAIYSNGNTTWNGAPPQEIDGDFHTNGWLKIEGSTSGWITGMASAFNIDESTAPPTVFGEFEDRGWPLQFDIADFR